MNDLEHVVLPPVPIPSCSSSSSTGATSLHEDSKQILKRDYRPAWLIASALSLASSNENREKAESKSPSRGIGIAGVESVRDGGGEGDKGAAAVLPEVRLDTSAPQPQEESRPLRARGRGCGV